MAYRLLKIGDGSLILGQNSYVRAGCDLSAMLTPCKQAVWMYIPLGWRSSGHPDPRQELAEQKMQMTNLISLAKKGLRDKHNPEDLKCQLCENASMSATLKKQCALEASDCQAGKCWQTS